MRLEEAKSIIHTAYPNFKITNSVDFGGFFVFSIAPTSHDTVREGEWISGLKSVDKKDGTILTFNPLQ